MTFNARNGLGCHNDADCEGGYRLVTQFYVDQVAPVTDPPYPHLGPKPPEPVAVELVLEWERRSASNARHAVLLSSRRASAAASSYPCPNCNPDQFLRWQRGEWPYPPRDGNRTVANEPPSDDAGLFADLATPYGGPHAGEDF